MAGHAMNDPAGGGEWQRRSGLPAIRDLAWRVGLTPGTLARACSRLTDDGTPDASVGRGPFVAEAHPPAVMFDDPPPVVVDSTPHWTGGDSDTEHLLSRHRRPSDRPRRCAFGAGALSRRADGGPRARRGRPVACRSDAGAGGGVGRHPVQRRAERGRAQRRARPPGFTTRRSPSSPKPAAARSSRSLGTTTIGPERRLLPDGADARAWLPQAGPGAEVVRALHRQDDRPRPEDQLRAAAAGAASRPSTGRIWSAGPTCRSARRICRPVGLRARSVAARKPRASGCTPPRNTPAGTPTAPTPSAMP